MYTQLSVFIYLFSWNWIQVNNIFYLWKLIKVISVVETVLRNYIISGHRKVPILVAIVTRQIRKFEKTGSVNNVFHINVQLDLLKALSL